MNSQLWLLTLTRWKEFFREPIAIFWVYGFPLILAVILGVAFRNRPIEKIPIILQGSKENTDALAKALKTDERLDVQIFDEAESRKRLRTAKTAIVVIPQADAPGYSYLLDPDRPDSVLAKAAVDNALLRSAIPNAPIVKENKLTEPGSRYVDFLVPGLLGANLMGGGLWGVGFAIVDMRVKKLLKRLMATPIKKHYFFLSIMISRVVFTVVEVILFLVFAKYILKVQMWGSVFALAAVALMGAMCFAGFGLLVASRAKKMETASGLMNLVMLPSYLFGGVFFASANFPEFLQPILSKMPLNALNDGLRAVINDGAGITDIGMPLLILAVWTIITFGISARIFRWLG